MTDVRTMSSAEKERFHRDAEARIRVFRYERPSLNEEVKEVSVLSKGRLATLLVQNLKDGGENNLHYHTNSETIWMVLRGRARFYGVGDVLIGELGPNEGILMPGGARYWFEKTGSEDLEILQMMASEPTQGSSERINVEAHKPWMKEAILQVYETDQ